MMNRFLPALLLLVGCGGGATPEFEEPIGSPRSDSNVEEVASDDGLDTSDTSQDSTEVGEDTSQDTNPPSVDTGTGSTCDADGACSSTPNPMISGAMIPKCGLTCSGTVDCGSTCRRYSGCAMNRCTCYVQAYVDAECKTVDKFYQTAWYCASAGQAALWNCMKIRDHKWCCRDATYTP